jgi:hypothetical protein
MNQNLSSYVAYAGPLLVAQFSASRTMSWISINTREIWQRIWPNYTPIQPSANSLDNHYKEMAIYDLKGISMAEFGTSEESPAVICTPGEVLLPDNLQTFPKHMEISVKLHKLSVITRTQSAPGMGAVQFLKELSGVESSHVRL